MKLGKALRLSWVQTFLMAVWGPWGMDLLIQAESKEELGYVCELASNASLHVHQSLN